MFRVSGGIRLSSRRAFTLVELLVVVAIIALLVSILLPTLNKAKAAAKMVMCQTNLHAIGKAAYLYAAENDDYIPRGMALPNNDPSNINFGYYQFAGRLSPYVGGPVVPLSDADEDDEYEEMYNVFYDAFKHIPAYRCPSFQDPEYVLTYVVNARRMERNPASGDTETGVSQLFKLPVPPAEVLYIGELNPVTLLATDYFGAYDFFYVSQLPFDAAGSPNDDTESRVIHSDDERHLGRTTMIFFDGHAESRWLDADKMPVELFYPDFD